MDSPAGRNMFSSPGRNLVAPLAASLLASIGSRYSHSQIVRQNYYFDFDFQSENYYEICDFDFEADNENYYFDFEADDENYYSDVSGSQIMQDWFGGRAWDLS